MVKQVKKERKLSKKSSVFRGKKFDATRMGFEPTRAEPIGLAVQRLNHSATSSCTLPFVFNACVTRVLTQIPIQGFD